MSETSEPVTFAVPLPAHCQNCLSPLNPGTTLPGVTKTRVRADSTLTFVYAFACRSCNAPCAFARRAGARTYAAHTGLRVAVAEPTKPCSDRALLAAALARRDREEEVRARRARGEEELERLRRDRDAKYADNAGACSAAAARLAGKTTGTRKAGKTAAGRVRRRRGSEGARTRARCVRAALGEERAKVVRRAVRSLQARGVRLAPLAAGAKPR